MIQLTSLQWPADQGHHRCWAWGSHFSAPPPAPDTCARLHIIPASWLPGSIQVGSRCFWLSLDRQGSWGNENPEEGSVSLGGVSADMVWECRGAGPWGGRHGGGSQRPQMSTQLTDGG